MALVVALAVLMLVWSPSWLWVRPATLALCVVAGLGVAGRAFSRSWPVLRSSVSVAGFLESKLPEYRTDLRTILEWKQAPESETVAALREIVVERVTARLRSDERPAKQFPRYRWKGLASSAVGAVGLLVLMLVVNPTRTLDAAGLLVTGRTADEALVTRMQAPVLGNIEMELSPPAYTGRPREEIRYSTGRILAPAGTDVVWRAETLVEARSGVMHLRMGDTVTDVALAVVDGRLESPRWTLLRNGSYTVDVITPGGDVLSDPIERSLAVEPDRPPEVELLFPTSDQTVVPSEVVNFEYAATDDYGIQKVLMSWYFVGQENEIRTMVLQDRALGGMFQEHVPMELQPLYLQAGDEVVMYVEALDGAQPEPNRGQSRAVRLRVDSPEDQHYVVLELKEALLEALLMRLGAFIVQPWVTATVSEEGALAFEPSALEGSARVETVQASVAERAAWGELLGQWHALETAMATDTLSTDQDRESITATGRALESRYREFDRALTLAERPAELGTLDAAGWEAPAQEAGRLGTVLERTVLLLQDDIALHQAGDIQRTMEEMESLRENLRELLERYRNTRDPELREQIEQEFRRLEARMRELLERLAAQAEELPYEHLNMEGLDPSEMAEQVQSMTSGLDSLRQMLDQGNIDGALQALEDMEAALDQMASEMDQAQSGPGPDGVSELDQAMGELMDRLNDLEVAEQSILEQTEAIEQQLREQRQEEIREQVQQQVQQAIQQVEQARQNMEQQPDNLLSSETQQRLQETEQGLQRLQELLEQEDLPGVVDQAARMGTQLSDLTWRLRSEEDVRLNDPAGRQQATRELRQSQRTTDVINDVSQSMEELMELARPNPSAQQRQQLDELGQQQQQVSDQLGQLQQRAQEMGERMPTIPEQFGQPMEQIGQGMQQSQQSLRQGQSGPAIGGQQQALEAMRSLRQQMQQMTRQQRQQQQRQSGNGRPGSQERVEIPEDQEGARQDYRRQVQEAMREGGLESFQEQLQRYYETLVR